MWTRSARTLLAATAAVLMLLAGAVPAGADHPLDGTLQGVHADYFDEGTSTTDWWLDTGARTLDVLPTTLPALSPEQNVVELDDEEPGAGVAGPVTAASPLVPPALGARETAVIAFKFASDPVIPPWTIDTIRSRIFTGSDSTNAFFREESYEQLSLTGKAGNLQGDVYGWYTLPVVPTTCDYTTWATAAKLAAAADGFSATGYEHVIYVFPTQSVCEWAGLAYMPGTESWINGDLTVRVTGHEIGHNLGLHHANSWLCTGASGQAVPVSSDCEFNFYNDPFDVMGAWGSRHSSGWNLQRLGLLQPTNVQTVTATGTYSMSSALEPTTDPTTLRIPRTYAPDGSVADWYYVEVREAGGFFESFTGPLASALTGVSIRAVPDPSQTGESALIDTDAGGGIADAPLEPGKTFSDGRVSVTTLSAGSGAGTVSINMSAPPLDQQSPSAPTGLSHAPLGAGLRLSWNASGDNVGVTTYPVYRDGVQVGSSGSRSFDDATVTPGQHVYTVYAQDAAGNRSPASAPYVVTVPAPSTVALKPGANPSSVDRTGPRLRLYRKRLRGGRLQLTAKARDKTGIARIELRIDGRKVTARRASRLSYRWRMRPGSHRIVALAYDRRGNRTTYRLLLRLARA